MIHIYRHVIAKIWNYQKIFFLSGLVDWLNFVLLLILATLKKIKDLSIVHKKDLSLSWAFFDERFCFAKYTTIYPKIDEICDEVLNSKISSWIRFLNAQLLLLLFGINTILFLQKLMKFTAKCQNMNFFIAEILKVQDFLQKCITLF